MENWMSKASRITKYSPEYRNEQGIYIKDTWTSYCDIGKKFDNKVLSREDYLNVENSYIKAANLFLEYWNCEKVEIKSLEKYSEENDFEENNDSGLLSTYGSIKEGDIVDVVNLSLVLKLIFREYLWCIIISNKERIQIRFGYDYYMYFVAEGDYSKIDFSLKELGLFKE